MFLVLGMYNFVLGGTWADVLRELPPSEFTMIHGQCTSVGVAGYILGKNPKDKVGPWILK